MTLRTRGMFRNCIIAIESSCDDSSLAILNNKNKIIYELNSSQKNTHQPFGGIVPQLAAQGHKAAFTRFIEDRLLKRIIKTKSVKYIALTTGPGIRNCLSAGYEFAAFLSRSQNIPVIPINHLVTIYYFILCGNIYYLARTLSKRFRTRKNRLSSCYFISKRWKHSDRIFSTFRNVCSFR